MMQLSAIIATPEELAKRPPSHVAPITKYLADVPVPYRKRLIDVTSELRRMG